MANSFHFWAKVAMGRTDECWLWVPGAAMKSGYGRYRPPGNRDTPKVIAHRYAYTLAKGPVPPGLLVLHSCDTPLCCNPDHLRVGTHADNMQDMLSRGRESRLRPKAKLTPEQVLQIRRDTESHSHSALAKRFGVSKSTISEIVSGHIWRDIGG